MEERTVLMSYKKPEINHMDDNESDFLGVFFPLWRL